MNSPFSKHPMFCLENSASCLVDSFSAEHIHVHAFLCTCNANDVEKIHKNVSFKSSHGRIIPQHQANLLGIWDFTTVKMLFYVNSKNLDLRQEIHNYFIKLFLSRIQ